MRQLARHSGGVQILHLEVAAVDAPLSEVCDRLMRPNRERWWRWCRRWRWCRCWRRRGCWRWRRVTWTDTSPGAVRPGVGLRILVLSPPLGFVDDAVQARALAAREDRGRGPGRDSTASRAWIWRRCGCWRRRWCWSWRRCWSGRWRRAACTRAARCPQRRRRGRIPTCADIGRVGLKGGIGRAVIPDGVAGIVSIAFRPISPARALSGGRGCCRECQCADDEQRRAKRYKRSCVLTRHLIDPPFLLAIELVGQFGKLSHTINCNLL